MEEIRELKSSERAELQDNKVTFTRHYKKKKQKPSKDPFDIPDKYARKNSRIRRPKS